MQEQGCEWNEFAVLYRQHSHRDELVRELAERGIPFSIEGLDVLDTAEVRDVVACLTAAVSPNDAASLFRVAALPRFAIDPNGIAGGDAGGAAGGTRSSRGVGKARGRFGGAGVRGERAPRSGERRSSRRRCGERLWSGTSSLQRSALIDAFVKFVEAWQKKPIAETGSPSEFLDYLDYFVQAKGKIELEAIEEDGVRLVTAHAAKGLGVPACGDHSRFLHIVPNFIQGAADCVSGGIAAAEGASQDDKTLHEEEERRLFYVAMTRAKDTLAIYAQPGPRQEGPEADEISAGVHGESGVQEILGHATGGGHAGYCRRRRTGNCRAAIERGRVAAAAAVGELRRPD